MTLEQYRDKIRNIVQQSSAQATSVIRVPAANKLRAAIINRIANEGKATNGSLIGTYSTKPSYYTKKQFVKGGAFKPQGKTGKSAFDNGKPHKSMFLPQGYTELRNIQGRRTDIMNWEYSGDLMLDFKQQETQTAILIGFTRIDQSKKRKGLEARFKPAFSPSKEEINDYNKECAAGYAKLISQTLKG